MILIAFHFAIIVVFLLLKKQSINCSSTSSSHGNHGLSFTEIAHLPLPMVQEKIRNHVPLNALAPFINEVVEYKIQVYKTLPRYNTNNNNTFESIPKIQKQVYCEFWFHYIWLDHKTVNFDQEMGINSTLCYCP